MDVNSISGNDVMPQSVLQTSREYTQQRNEVEAEDTRPPAQDESKGQNLDITG